MSMRRSGNDTNVCSGALAFSAKLDALCFLGAGLVCSEDLSWLTSRLCVPEEEPWSVHTKERRSSQVRSGVKWPSAGSDKT